MHLREFKVDTITARRASSSPQTVAQPFSVIYSFCYFLAPYLTEWYITFYLLLLAYYLWAITLKASDQRGIFQKLIYFFQDLIER